MISPGPLPCLIAGEYQHLAQTLPDMDMQHTSVQCPHFLEAWVDRFPFLGHKRHKVICYPISLAHSLNFMAHPCCSTSTTSTLFDAGKCDFYAWSQECRRRNIISPIPSCWSSGIAFFAPYLHCCSFGVSPKCSRHLG